MNLMSLNRNSLCSSESSFVSTSELAQILGLTERRIQQLVGEGMPRIANGRFDLRACVRFYIGLLHDRLDENSSETIVKEKIRLYRARAEKAEVESLKLRQSSLDAESVRQDALRVAQFIREAFLSLPGRLAPDLGDKPVAYVKNILEKVVLETLNSVAEKLEG